MGENHANKHSQLHSAPRILHIYHDTSDFTPRTRVDVTIQPGEFVVFFSFLFPAYGLSGP